jgi:lysozyme family protein
LSAQNFTRSLQLVLLSEGGYVNHPKDPGGATNKGVTQRVYDAYRKAIDAPPQSVKLISAGEVGSIYKDSYWQPIRGDELPAGVDYVVFDYAVNSGTVKAAKALQEALGVKVDGRIGLLTLDALKRADRGAIIRSICGSRLGFLKRLATWTTFGRGWSRRVDAVKQSALFMTK